MTEVLPGYRLVGMAGLLPKPGSGRARSPRRSQRCLLETTSAPLSQSFSGNLRNSGLAGDVRLGCGL